MSEEAATTAASTEASTTGGQSGTYTPPATQAEMDRIITDRISRERAKFGDYDDLKTKAAEYDKVVEANKTEAQKLADQLAAAQAKVAGYETEKQVATWKAKVAETSGVPATALAGTTLEEITAHAEVLKPLIGKEPPKQGALGPYVPGEGSSPAGALGGPAQAFADYLSAQLGR